MPSEETDSGIPGLRGEVVAEPAVVRISAQRLDDLEEVVHVVPAHRQWKGIRQEPAPQITLKSHSSGNTRHAREQRGFEGFLEEKRHVELFFAQPLD
jgi:hypothetical protein